MKRHIFDMYDNIPTGVDSTSVTPGIEIDPQVIKMAVTKKIQTGTRTKTRKSGFKKKLTVTLIAAAVGVAALGTIGVGAMGAFNEVFGQRFAGESVNGVYPGGSVQISSSQNVKAEMLGIAGDPHKVMAAVSVKSADGTPFVDYEDIENTIISPSMYCNYLDENGEVLELLPCSMTNNTGSEEGYVSASVSAWTKMQAGSSYDNTFDIPDYDMRLTAPDTVKIIYFIGRDDYSLMGETMQIHQPELYIMHKDELIADNTLDIFIMHNGEKNEDKFDHFVNTLAKEIEIVKSRKDSLKENQTIIAVTDREPAVDNYNQPDSKPLNRKLYIVTVEKVQTDITGSWQLNYKSTEREMTSIPQITSG